MKISITCVTPVLQAILDFFPDIISFQHVFHLGVGRSQIEWKLKAKTQISVFPWAKIGQNDHSNPYIESTTVLSDSLCTYRSSHITLYVHVFLQGILAGIWPCGTITLLAELFISESKAQVYGALHDFLQSNADATKDINE